MGSLGLSRRVLIDEAATGKARRLRSVVIKGLWDHPKP